MENKGKKLKYLTEKIIEAAIVFAWQSANDQFDLKRDHGAIVFGFMDREEPILHSYQFSINDVAKTDWEYPYDKIADSKIINMVDQYTDGSHRIDVTDLFEGEYEYYGGCQEGRLFCAVSGQAEEHDEYIAKVVMAGVVARMKEAQIADQNS